MTRLTYEERAKNLSQAVDIAIKTLQENPPKGFTPALVEHTVNCYLDWRNKAINPEPQFKNSKSLKYIENDVFTLFQESAGYGINLFWDKIKEQKLPFKRENKLVKILKRNKIKNQIEYDFIADVIVPYEQEKLINQDDIKILNQLMSDFEEKQKRG